MSELVEQVALIIAREDTREQRKKGSPVSAEELLAHPGYGETARRIARAALSVLEARIEALERELAEAVAADRERCAGIARSYEEGLGAPGCINRSHPTDAYLTGVADASAAIAAAIRTGEAEQ